MALRRKTQTGTLSLTTTALTTDPFEVRQSLYAAVYVPSTVTGATFAFQGAQSRSGTFGAIYDTSNAAVTISITTTAWHVLPSQVMQFDTFKIVLATLQTTASTLTIQHS